MFLTQHSSISATETIQEFCGLALTTWRFTVAQIPLQGLFPWLAAKNAILQGFHGHNSGNIDL